VDRVVTRLNDEAPQPEESNHAEDRRCPDRPAGNRSRRRADVGRPGGRQLSHPGDLQRPEEPFDPQRGERITVTANAVGSTAKGYLTFK
jgi:hypothetical protein